MRRSFIFLSLLATIVSAQNCLVVSPDVTPIEYSPMIFGQFIEHFDDQIYGGIFDPNHPLSDEDGFRKDVITALKELRTPVVRWPGGCFVSTYHWLDGVGPERQPVYDKTWQVEDPNTFGTDEYIKWCRKVGCEPYICTNAGTGTPEEMSDWVEYCNLTIGKWGRLRAANGHPEPYNVKYWSVGNENWGAHELGARTVAEWGPLVRESAKLMRSVTKNAKLFAAATSDKNWTLPLLKAAAPYLDYVSIHGYWDPLFHYNNPAPYINCMMKTGAPEADIMRTINILDEAGLGDGRIKIAYDEWNLRNWHHPWHGDLRRGFDLKARRKNDIAATYTMADALFSACFLNACLRHADRVGMACFSPIVNTRGAIRVDSIGIIRRSTYYVLWMYANLLPPYIVSATITAAPLIHDDQQTPVLDAIVATDAERKRWVCAVVNKHPSQSQRLQLNLPVLAGQHRSQLQATVLAGNSPDDYNDRGRNNVTPQSQILPLTDGTVTLPPHSLTFISYE